MVDFTDESYFSRLVIFGDVLNSRIGEASKWPGADSKELECGSRSDVIVKLGLQSGGWGCPDSKIFLELRGGGRRTQRIS